MSLNLEVTNIPSISENTLELVRNALKEQNNQYETAIIIDLETLGKTNDSVVFNLAALFFSLNPDKQELLEQEEPYNSLNLRFDVLEQVGLGNKMDSSTIEFWGNSKNKLALETINKLPLSDFKQSMEELNKWVRNLKVKYGCRVYHRGMDFDGPILDNLYKIAGIKKEWVRGDGARDIRSYIDALLGTTTGYVPGISKEITRITHTALGDCYNDAMAMQIAYKLNKEILK